MATLKPRLYVDQELAEGQSLVLSREQSHYLANVMRLKQKSHLALFNGRDGEWRAEIAELDKRSIALTILEKNAPQRPNPDIWLAFAPIKKARTDFIVEKATELGVSRILPVFTEFTNSERVRSDRLRAIAIEAAEQCGGTALPEIAEPLKLEEMLSNWPKQRSLFFADEEGSERSGIPSPYNLPAALLIGPEGGFSAKERKRLREMKPCVPIRLGPRILRADTAAIAGLTLLQQALGDWCDQEEGHD